MNKEEFIGKLQLVYVGDRNAFNEIVEDNQKLKNEVVYSKVEIDRLNNIIKELSKDVDMWNKKYNEQFNIINELEKYIHNELVLDFYNDDMPCELIINKMEKMIKELKENNK